MKRDNLPFCLILTLALLIPLSMCTTPAEAQNLRCTYTHQKKDDPEKGYKTYKDMLLDVCDGRSLFYNERDFVYDSLFSISFDKNGSMLKNEAAEQLTRTKGALHWMTEMDYPDGTFTQYYKFFQTVIGNGTLEMPAWQLTDEEQEISGYTCRKATALYLGREWTAWFTEDVPSQAGPWLLWGLPGLIVEARDADNFILFKLTGVEPLNDNHRAIFLTDWLRNYTNKSHNVYEYDIKEAEAVYTKMRSDISFAAHMSNPGTKVMTKDETGKMVPAQAPPYLPLIPTEYWKSKK
ncbi:MAG: GLPGLI family protein [Bacteroidales bacterium]|nr:GLPGLI family protein [Bacteroidales bacterium]